MKIQKENRNSQLKQLEGFYVNDICWPIKKRTTQVLIRVISGWACWSCICMA